MGKIRAFLLHLAISATVVGVLCAIVLFVWYPGLLFDARGAWNALRILLSVDLVLGPALTLIIYRPGKPKLKLDMSIIAAIQLAALFYGATVLYQERPYYLVFAVDRFELLGRYEVDTSDLDDKRLLDKPFRAPIPVVAARPTDPRELQALMDEVLFQGKPDLERRPVYWRAYEERKDIVLARVRDLDELGGGDGDADVRIREFIGSLNQAQEPLGFVPMIGRDRNFAIVANRNTGELLGLLDIDPWAIPAN